MTETSLRDLVGNGFTLPTEWYNDRAIFEREKARILRRAWHYVTHTGELARAGDQVVWEIAGVPIVLTRADDGGIRGFVNICQHRAHPVVMESCNRRTMQCHYHGWTYDLDGALRSAPKSGGEVDMDDVCLQPIQVTTLGPTVWANIATDAPSFAEWTDGFEARLLADGCDVTRYAHCFEHTWEIPANWKVFQDNTIECYHCPTTHPELSRALVMDPEKQELEVGGRYWIHHRIPFREGVAEGPTFRGPDYFYSWVFPTTYLQHAGKGFDIGSVEVLDVDRIRFRHVYFGDPAMPEDEKVAGARMLAADPTINQDVDICRRVQHSHDSGLAPPGRLVAYRERLLSHFYSLIVELMNE